MKNLLLSVLMLTCTSVIFAKEPQVPEKIIVEIGEYNALGKMFMAEAYISKDTSLVYVYRLPATHVFPELFYSEYKPCFYIACTPTTNEILRKIAAKYREWAETAKKNAVGKFEKDIDIEFPIFKVSIHKNAKGYPKFFDVDTKKFKFKVFDTQKSPSLMCNTLIKDVMQTLVTGLVFGSPDEFDAFVDFLDPEKVKQRVREGKTTLFAQYEINKYY